jgi:hypothetical protein
MKRADDALRGHLRRYFFGPIFKITYGAKLVFFLGDFLKKTLVLRRRFFAESPKLSDSSTPFRAGSTLSFTKDRVT